MPGWRSKGLWVMESLLKTHEKEQGFLWLEGRFVYGATQWWIAIHKFSPLQFNLIPLELLRSWLSLTY